MFPFSIPCNRSTSKNSTGKQDTRRHPGIVIFHDRALHIDETTQKGYDGKKCKEKDNYHETEKMQIFIGTDVNPACAVNCCLLLPGTFQD